MSNQTTGHHVFRAHDDGASDIRLECWGHSSKLDSNKIRTIKDTIRKGSSKVATSVPSPFARMHLFDTAFKMVSEQLDGDTVYHQLVSDCLDIFQLLFTKGNENTGIKFKQWNKEERIKKLNESPDGHPHKLLAASLDLFFTNKFSDVQDITLIYYNDILLGGTSPFTVFFTSPNWHREMEENGIFLKSPTGEKYFDLNFEPLHKRDKVFVEYIWKFYLSHRSVLNEKCDGFSTYIRNSIENNNREFERKVNNEWSEYINNPQKLEQDYQRIVINNSNTYLQINNLFSYAIKTGDTQEKIESQSDFKIKPTVDFYRNEVDGTGIPTNPRRPLVLYKGMNEQGTYTYGKEPWRQYDIRYGMYRETNGEPILLAHRELPGHQIQYPFVTTGDFLEDNLVKMPFKINNNKFLVGYSGDFNFLLPIKKEYFNFFTKEDLQKSLEIIPLDNKIIVKLKIPIQNTKGNPNIVLQKEYDLDSTPIAQCKAGLAVFPFYRIKDADENLQKLNDYTVLFADKNDKLKVDRLEFWQTENIVVKKSIDVVKPEPRTKRGVSAASYYYKVNSPFDIIEIKLSDDLGMSYSGLVVPLFKEVYNSNATKKFTFAIDFGTSNTHISYTESETDRDPKAFVIPEKEMQMVLLNKPGESNVVADKYRLGYDGFPEIDALVNREFIPAILGKADGSYSHFPIRTATCEKSSILAESVDLFGNINVGFFIDSDETKPENCNYQTNLKWLYENRNDSYDSLRIGAFFKTMLLLVRNKVVMSGGSIEDTKVVWLVPLSMRDGTVENFDLVWKRSFSEVFHGTCSKGLLEPISESVAPYFYLKNFPDAKIANFADALNIDIGGGTTDVMFFMRKADKYLSTSFRFAGGDIWGAGLKGNEKNNGFLKNFEEVRKQSKQNKSQKEDTIYKNFIKDHTLKAEDVTSLLFRYDDYFNFSESINRNKPALKLIFFLHYSSIVYHLVQLFESNNLNIPRYFTFTGKGSQYINLMCRNERLTIFTKLLLKEYTSLACPPDFRVVLTSNPKEATANGAVLFVSSPDKNNISLSKDDFICHWGCENNFVTNFQVNSTKIGEVARNTDFHKSVLKNLQAFVEKTLRNPEIVKFLSEYQINNLEEYEQFLTNRDATSSGELHDSYYTMLENIKVNEEVRISESFFFFALKDALYALSKKIVEQ